MKVLALASYPTEAAATRYRLAQFVAPLAERDIELTIHPFIDAQLFEPGAIFKRIRARSRQHRAGIPQQRQVVRVVAGDASSPLFQVVNEKAEVEDVCLVREDVVLEASLEAEDVVERDRAGADHAHSRARLTQAGGQEKRGAAAAPLSIWLA